MCTLQEQSAIFITPENLDEAIDRALANTQDFNYTIDLQGNQYAGRISPSHPRKRRKLPVLNVALFSYS